MGRGCYRCTAAKANRSFGTLQAVEPVNADANGPINASALKRTLDAGPRAPTIVCLQAGNVNTGACDDLAAACAVAHRYGAWVHVDGAFGLWAAVSPSKRHLVRGIEMADSWEVDGHRWLNVPTTQGTCSVRIPWRTRPRCRTRRATWKGTSKAIARLETSCRLVAASSRARYMGGASTVGSSTLSWSGRPVLRVGSAIRGSAPHDRGRRDRQPRGAQSGPGELRRGRTNG